MTTDLGETTRDAEIERRVRATFAAVVQMLERGDQPTRHNGRRVDWRRRVALNPQRRLLPIATAAAITAAGITGLVLSRPSGRDDVATIPPAVIDETPSSRPDLYPLIEGLADDAIAEDFLDPSWEGHGAAPTAAALIGQVDDDGRVLSVLVVRAGLRAALPSAAGEATRVFGVAGTLYESTETGTQTVYWGTPPYFNLLDGLPYLSVTGQPPIAGADPVSFLAAAEPEFASFTAIEEDGPLRMAIGNLPPGYELLAGPQSLSQQPMSGTLRTSLNGPFVQVFAFNPLIEYDHVGALEPIDIHGRSGWVSDSGNSVVWQVDDNTWARAVASNADGDAVAFAESIRFVDRAEWVDRYNPQPVSTNPEFAPITGPFEYPATPSEDSAVP